MAFLSGPKITKAELKRHLAKHFNLGTLLSYQRLERGYANSLYHVKTTKGDFVVKIAVRHNSEKINYEIKLLNSLQDLPVPKLLKTKGNKDFFDYRGHKTLVYPFLPGEEKKKFTKSMLFEVGNFLGKLHLQTEGFVSPVKRIDYYEVSPARIKRVAKESHNQKDVKIKGALQYVKENALKYVLPASLPSGAMHIDLKPENTLFIGERLTGVVDFDNSYNGPLIFDLADTLMWFCSRRGTFDMEGAKKIYQGYQGARKLNMQERNLLLTALHRVFCGITLCGIDLLNKKTLPKDLVVWVIDNLLEAEKNLKMTNEQSQIFLAT